MIEISLKNADEEDFQTLAKSQNNLIDKQPKLNPNPQMSQLDYMGTLAASSHTVQPPKIKFVANPLSDTSAQQVVTN